MLVLLLWSTVFVIVLPCFKPKTLTMLRSRSALNMQTAQQSLHLPRQPMGAAGRLGKHLLMVLLTLVFYPNDVLLRKWKCHTYSYCVLQGWFPRNRCVCESLHSSTSANPHAERAQTSLRASCTRREERLPTPAKHLPKKYIEMTGFSDSM